MLNKEFLTKEICKIIYEDGCYDDEKPSYIDDIDELHDIGIRIWMNGFYIEEHDMLYYEMCSLLNQESDYIIAQVNDFIDEEFQSYYGDPAFSSAQDYWGYILG